MTRRRSRHGDRAFLLSLSLAACGPYAEVAQKLDVTARIAGDTWIAAGPNRATDTRVLLVGKPDLDGVAPFAFTCVADDCQTPVPVKNVSSPIGVAALQGTWTEVGSSGDTTLRVAHTYATPAITGAQAAGSQRNDTPYVLHVTVARSGNQLVVSGDPQLSGTYVALSDALARLGTATAYDAACAYQVASISIQSSEVRIIGFGGGAMIQYRQAATYVGTIAGSVTVKMSGITLPIEMRITYDAFQDEGGVSLSGTQVTTTGWDGVGSMSDVVRFTLAPPSLDPATVTTPITGAIDYSNIQLNGTASGSYHVTIDGGGTADVSAVGTPSPNVADCLDLP